MRRRFLWSFLFLAAVCLTVYSAEAGEKQGPRMKMQTTQFDCGSVIEGESIQHTFVVLNEGDEPLEIQKVAPG